jgi:hypothetical protein
MKKNLLVYISLCFLVTVTAFPLTITDDKAIELGRVWFPESLRQLCENHHETPRVNDPNLAEWLHADDNAGPYHFPLIFKIPNDPNDYVLLTWSDCFDNLYWRLLKTNDEGETFQFVCDIDKPLGGAGFWWKLRLVDLTGDNIPELVWDGVNVGMANKGGNQAIGVWQWRNGCFLPTLPYDPAEIGMTSDYGLFTNTGIDLDDLDGDNKAEIIVGPYMGFHWDTYEEGDGLVNWTMDQLGEVWRFNGNGYELWYRFDPTDSSPVYVPSLGVFHPSTIPFSELSNPGNGKITIFVSDPAGSLTSDDFVTNSFTYNNCSLSFKKIWKNNKQPSESSANFEFSGVPVKQIVRKSQGEWQTNPSDPFILSPYGAMEYHFCGKYVELETNRALIFPELKQKAEKFFNIHPDKTTYLATIPIKAKFGNSNKISQISAMICIKKTGYQEKAEETKKVDEKNKPEPNQSKKK